MATPARPRWLRVAAWAGALVALGTVFAAYRNPHTVVDLANRVWACF
ncbi:MAG: hypothetical protein HY856_11400 [Burkholderiales bacterium]|jgi:hypothetical protein|nr:hypothetical protein [Burkholderiales bacterium]